MLTVLRTLTTKFTRVDTRIIVTSYFPILSPKSNPFKVPQLLTVHGIAFSPLATHGAVFDKLVTQCMQFWTESTAALTTAIAGCGD
jgi:hypothetical protein